LPLWLDRWVLGAVDAAFSLRAPAPVTGAQALHTRVVSHRGERDDRRVFENTYAAFDPLRGSGVFGLECDVRWTRDLVPVVFHDAHLLRLFGDRRRLADLDWPALHATRPEIPRLDEFVRRYTGEFHLMVEIKHEHYPDPAAQDRRLAQALAPAIESGRCHVLSLVPAIFGALPSIPARQTLGVARLNTRAISAEALAAGRGGFCCQFALLDGATVARHHAAGQAVGCGFPRSRQVLHREMRRGVDYVFTNSARELERWRRQALAPAARPGIPAPRH
jgi:glycerophosphoryl diester phosphodiesterase